ncbi:MAG: hypothetical protein N2578_06725, partial [Bdellovibrionaceae bacterium]|nr:hypothetical protein [Pseudobdellovibrionaceae bacterium]
MLWIAVGSLLLGCATKPLGGGREELEHFRVGEGKLTPIETDEFNHIPAEVNPLVDKWIAYFQGRGRPHMERYLARSTRYEGLMKEVLR